MFYNKLNYLWFVPMVLIIASVAIGALGGHTAHYQCKYVQSVTAVVKDHEKYATALYTIKYNDGTTGATDDVSDKPYGVTKGAVCRTVFNYGFPYQFTNRNVKDESVVK